MKFSSRILALLGGLLATATLAFAADAARTVTITANDNMRFSVSKIVASPGEALHVKFTDTGTVPKAAMGHNWVLLKADQQPDAYAAAAITAGAEEYFPAALSNEVIAHIKLLGPGETGEVTFNAPTTPGSYPFLCSFPGHCGAGMKGVLIVK